MATLTPQIIGRAENAHKPLMEHALAGSSLTFPQWVALTLISAGQSDGAGLSDGEGLSDGAGLSDVAAKIIGALKVSPVVAAEALTGLREAGLITAGNALTDAGAATFTGIRQQIDTMIARVYAGIDPYDLAVAGQVLATITAQADAVAAELTA